MPAKAPCREIPVKGILSGIPFSSFHPALGGTLSNKLACMANEAMVPMPRLRPLISVRCEVLSRYPGLWETAGWASSVSAVVMEEVVPPLDVSPAPMVFPTRYPGPALSTPADHSGSGSRRRGGAGCGCGGALCSIVGPACRAAQLHQSRAAHTGAGHRQRSGPTGGDAEPVADRPVDCGERRRPCPAAWTRPGLGPSTA